MTRRARTTHPAGAEVDRHTPGTESSVQLPRAAHVQLRRAAHIQLEHVVEPVA